MEVIVGFDFEPSQSDKATSAVISYAAKHFGGKFNGFYHPHMLFKTHTQKLSATLKYIR